MYKEYFRRVSKYARVFTDWYKAVFPFNRFISKSQTLHFRKGGFLEVQNIFSHETLWAAAYFDGENEYHLNKIVLPENATIFDLGANMGFFTIEAHRLFPDAHITSYEPHPSTFRILQGNAPFATLVEKAVSGRNGVLRFDDSNAHSTAYHLSPDGEIEVDAVTLDEVLADVAKVDLLKVDIEGAEFDVFENASAETMRKIDRILIEAVGEKAIGVHVSDSGKPYVIREKVNGRVEAMLKPLGFEIRWLEDWGVAYAYREGYGI